MICENVILLIDQKLSRIVVSTRNEFASLTRHSRQAAFGITQARATLRRRSSEARRGARSEQSSGFLALRRAGVAAFAAGVTRHPTKVISTLSLTLPMSNRIHSHIQSSLAAPEMAEESKVKRERCPFTFHPTCTHAQVNPSSYIRLLTLQIYGSKAIA